MAKKEEKKKVVKKADVAEAPEAEEKIEEAEEAEETVAEDNTPLDIIITNDPNAPLVDKIYVRQYSLEVHGPDYKSLAAEFCTKKPKNKVGMYLAVPATKIGKVEVRFREKSDADLHIDQQDPNAKIVDKVVAFTDKEAAVTLGSKKFDSTVVVSRIK